MELFFPVVVVSRAGPSATDLSYQDFKVAHKQLRRCWRRGISTCDSLPKAPSCTLALEGGGSATFFVVFAVKSKMSLSLLTMPLMKIHSLGKDLKSYLPALR